MSQKRTTKPAAKPAAKNSGCAPALRTGEYSYVVDNRSAADRARAQALGDVAEDSLKRSLRAGLEKVLETASIADQMLLGEMFRAYRAVKEVDCEELSWPAAYQVATKTRKLPEGPRDKYGYTLGHILVGDSRSGPIHLTMSEFEDLRMALEVRRGFRDPQPFGEKPKLTVVGRDEIAILNLVRHQIDKLFEAPIIRDRWEKAAAQEEAEKVAEVKEEKTAAVTQ